MSPVCLAISSGVVAGHVGLGATVPPLIAHGIEVWPLPTEVISTHGAVPGTRRASFSADQVQAVIDGLRATGALSRVDAVLTGYLGAPETATVVADLIEELSTRDAPPLLFCDPVLGDQGQIYLPEQVGEILRDRIVPHAHMAAPNITELGWLTGRELANEADVIDAARTLPCETVFVTSATRDGQAGILTVTSSSVDFAAGPDITRHLSGPGDFVSGRLLAGILTGATPAEASAAALFDVAVALTDNPNRDDLDLTRLFRRER